MARLAGTAVVTGAAGFVGSHLVDHLLAAGWRVRGIDDFSTGRLENLDRAKAYPTFDLIEGSVLDNAIFKSALADASHVYHLASPVGPEYVELDPQRVLTACIQAAADLIDAVRGRGAPVIFFASSSEVYGDSPDQPLTESHICRIGSPAVPRCAYALGKASAELLINTYVKSTSGGPAIIGRLFNVIGPRQASTHGYVVPTFIEQAQQGAALTVFGSGEQTRSFAFIDDVLRAIMLLSKEPSAYGQTVNIGSQEEVDIRTLANLVIRAVNSESQLMHEWASVARDDQWKDIKRRVPSTRLLYELTGYQCVTPLEDSIQKIISYAGRR